MVHFSEAKGQLTELARRAEAEEVILTRRGRELRRFCFAYALARNRNCPLLFVGDDFPATDVKIALAT